MDHVLDLDPDNVERLPSYYHVVCFGNINTLDASTPADETARLKKSGRPRTTLEGVMNNTLLQDELNELMSCLGKFKSAVYVRTAQASRWDLPKEVDDISDEIVKRATKYKVTSLYCSFRHP